MDPCDRSFLAYHPTTSRIRNVPCSTSHSAVIASISPQYFMSSLAVDTSSACLRLHAPHHAVELLEQARAAFCSQPNPTFPARRCWRTSSHVWTCPLASCLVSCLILPLLFSDLQLAGDPSSSMLASIIETPRRPARSGSRSYSVADYTRNVQDLSRDVHALILRAKRIDMTREPASLLRKLWEQVMSPIIDFLQTTHPSQSRIWCPIDTFSQLPLHAAGPYEKGRQNLSTSHPIPQPQPRLFVPDNTIH